jgi:hypothetical protein
MQREFVTTAAELGATVSRLVAELVEKNRVAAVKALPRAAYLCRTVAIEEVHATRPYVPVNLGQMVQSFFVTAQPDGARLENTAPHAAFMEFGTRPHWAPIGALERWAEQKLRGKIKSRSQRGDPARALARAVQRKIAREGTEPRGFYARASQRFPAIVEAQLRAALAKEGAR